MAGADPGGGGGLGCPDPPSLFWGTPKLYKEGENVVRVCANLPDPPIPKFCIRP